MWKIAIGRARGQVRTNAESGGRNTVKAKLEGKAGSILGRITQRPQLLGE